MGRVFDECVGASLMSAWGEDGYLKRRNVGIHDDVHRISELTLRLWQFKFELFSRRVFPYLSQMVVDETRCEHGHHISHAHLVRVICAMLRSSAPENKTATA